MINESEVELREMLEESEPSEASASGIDLEALVGPVLASAFANKGFSTLTAVQRAVLDPELAERDLRISSQTGSGKTVAIGLTLRHAFDGPTPSNESGGGRPRALVVAPTRELAKQVEVELAWLYAPMRVRVVSVIGGGNYRDERRALAAGPGIVVGTPGRLVDHLRRGTVDGSNLAAVVLDEADRMLDLGFREDLEAILSFAPEGHRTHLVSATFPAEVMALADHVQQSPARIEATPIGAANTDIEHVVHLVLAHERLNAITNLLLETPGATTLIFVRTRADVSELTGLLRDAGFRVDALSGEMEQRERNKALAAFKRGHLDALVATDVAARGIDVTDVTRVIHAEPPMDPESYTHRSGRTGRAGRKGTSSVLVPLPALNRVSFLLKRAGVTWRIEPLPTAESIERAREERLVAALTYVHDAKDDDGEAANGPAKGADAAEADDGAWALAKRIVATGEGTRAIARLLSKSRSAEPSACVITPVQPPARARQKEAPNKKPTQGRPLADHRSFGEPRGLRPARGWGDGDRNSGGDWTSPRTLPPAPRTADATDRARPRAGEWVSFRVSWGQAHGADSRRLLAMVCRRGAIAGSDVGAITVARTFSTVDVAAGVSAAFEQATSEPDPRDPRVKFSKVEGGRGGREMHHAPMPPQGDDSVVASPSSAPRTNDSALMRGYSRNRDSMARSENVYSEARATKPRKDAPEPRDAHRGSRDPAKRERSEAGRHASSAPRQDTRPDARRIVKSAPVAHRGPRANGGPDAPSRSATGNKNRAGAQPPKRRKP